jgi:sec-independent protein translocase protein TatB
MLDLSWGEIVLIGAAAVVFIGPKELPGALRTLGVFVGKARTMAREFQNNVDDMIRESELDDVKKHVQSAQNLASGGMTNVIQNAIDPKGELKAQVETALASPPAEAVPPVESLPMPAASALTPPEPTISQLASPSPGPIVAAIEPASKQSA